MNKACVACGCIFYAKQSNYKTCSKSCRTEINRRAARIFYKNNQSLMIRKASARSKRLPTAGSCVICNAAFSSRSGTRCCSKKCRNELNRLSNKSSYKPTVYHFICGGCEGEFSSSRNKRFCSTRCRKRLYTRARYRNDIQYRIADNLRSRLSKYITSDNISAVSDVGCSLLELIVHLESLFEEGMTWHNHGINGWHIDHIRPLCSFDLTKEDQLKEAINYKNLRPLWASENRKKGGKRD